MICHTCKSHNFVNVRIVHPVDVYTVGSSSEVISGMNACRARPSIIPMPSSSTGSATDANASGIAKSRVPVGKSAPNSLTYTATSRLTNLLPLYRRIIGSDIPACHREPAARVLRDTIGEPDFCSAPLPPDLYAT